MDGRLSPLPAAAFYTLAARYRIASYHNLRRNHAAWRRWLSQQGPILARVVVDRTFRQATATGGKLARFRPDEDGGGHAICLVGYTAGAFIVRNSWGADWGDNGFALRHRGIRRRSDYRSVRRRDVAAARGGRDRRVGLTVQGRRSGGSASFSGRRYPRYDQFYRRLRRRRGRTASGWTQPPPW